MLRSTTAQHLKKGWLKQANLSPPAIVLGFTCKDMCDCSVVEKAARLVKQQQRLAEELAALQSQALSAEEKEKLQALLSSAPADTRAKGRAGGKVQPSRASTKPGKQGGRRKKDHVQNKDYRHFPDKQPASADEQVPLPPLVQKLFSDAGVQDAVPWEGRPADPPSPDSGSLSYDANLGSHLEELTTKADWAKQLSNSTVDEPLEQREDFGTGIPAVHGDEDDEHIADVRLLLTSVPQRQSSVQGLCAIHLRAFLAKPRHLALMEHRVCMHVHLCHATSPSDLAPTTRSASHRASCSTIGLRCTAILL